MKKEKSFLEELLENAVNKAKETETLSGGIEPIRNEELSIVLSMGIIVEQSHRTLFDWFLERREDISDINRLLIIALAITNRFQQPCYYAELDNCTGKISFVTESGKVYENTVISNRAYKHIGINSNCEDHQVYQEYNEYLRAKQYNTRNEKATFVYINDIVLPLLNTSPLKHTRIEAEVLSEDYPNNVYASLNYTRRRVIMPINQFNSLFRKLC